MSTLIQGGFVLNGAGEEGFYADVLVEDGIIAQIAPGIPAQRADTVIDASGKTVTPGFIDMHRHCDVAPFTRRDFGVPELAQGITSTAAGNCGLAPLPSGAHSRKEMYGFLEPICGTVPQTKALSSYAAYTSALENAALPLNFAFFAGAGAIKTCVKGFAATPYTEAQTKRAAAYVDEAMRAGAMGVSVGIMYRPEVYSAAKEIARVVAPAAKYGGLLCAHIRGEGDSLTESVDEVIQIAADAGLRLHISHLKATGIHNWRKKIYTAIEHIEAARARGLTVTADFYPYDGGSSMMQSLLPPTVLNGGGEIFRRLGTAEGKEFFRREVYKQHPGWDNMVTAIGWDRILVSSVTQPRHASYGGQPVSLLARQHGYADPADFAADLLAAEDGKVGVIVRSMSQQDVDQVARLPWTALISDALYGGGGSPHPRLYGSFPRFIREYALERGVITLPAAINKMTAMPAKIMGLAGRGLLKQGYKADILVFSPERFTDAATYENPCQNARGMDAVLVNGSLAWQNETPLRPASGRLLRRGV